MALTRIDSYLVDLDSLGGITFDDQAGTPTFKVDAVNHRVGIGTTNPGYKLDVFASTFPAARLYSNYTASSKEYTSLLFGLPSTNTGTQIGHVSDTITPANSYFHITPYGLAEGANFSVRASGNVGIGTTNPSNKLHVIGSSRIDGTLNPYLVLYDGTNTGYLQIASTILDLYHNTDITLSPGQARSVTFKAGGNVGIGMTNPGAQVQIVASSNTEPLRLRATTASYNYFTHLHHSSGDIAYFGAGGGAALTSGTSSDYAIRAQQGALIFATNGDNERLRVTSSGNVGIGTTNPQKPLEAIVSASDYVSIGVSTLNLSQWSGIHFGYRENNNAYRKSVLAFERIDGAARGKIHILNNNDNNSNSATLSDSRLTIQSDGNVGIGTTNPASQLDVKSQINLTNSTNASRPALTGTYFGYSPSSYPVIQVGGASAGYNTVSIGYDPASNTNGAFTGDGSEVVFRNNVKFITPNSADNGWHLAMLCMKDGNVGIGTTVIPAKFFVKEGSSSVGFAEYNGGATIWLDGADGDLSGADYFNISANNSQQLTFGYAGGTNVTMSSTGNVGIGTTNPSSTLSIESATPSISLNTTTNNGTNIIIFNEAGSNAARLSVSGDYLDSIIELENYSNGWVSTGLVIRGNNVGIGTTNPGALLHTYGKTRFGNNFLYYGEIDHEASVTGANIYNSVDTGGHIFQRNGTELFRINANGNVGIGTTNPQAKLDVAGGILSTGITISNGVRAAAISDYSNVNGELPNPAILIGTNGSYPLSLIGDGSNGSTSGGIVASYYSSSSGWRRAIEIFNTTNVTGNLLLMKTGGNVGIGTANPSSKLHVVGDTILGGILNNVVTVSNDGTYASGSGSGTRLDVTYGGSVIARISNTGTGVRDGWFTLYDEGTSTINIAANASRGGNTYFNNGGNVGIGIASPTTKFHVYGVSTIAKFETNNSYVDINFANSQSSAGYIQYSNGDLRFFANSTNTPTLTITGGSPGRVGIGLTNPNEGFTSALTAYFSSAEPIYGGFGARSTGGAENWNDATNARSGGGWSLLLGNDANGPGPGAYFHPFSFEYASKDGGGNMTQFAIGYNTTAVYLRYRYSGVWSAWTQL